MIPHFLWVIEGKLARSAQPLDWDEVRAMGFNTILKLNTDAEGSDTGALERGMAVIKIPMQPWTAFQAVFGAPEEKDFDHAVEVMGMEHLYPTLVHCHKGDDRTGASCGRFRVIKQRWSTMDAWCEMLANGYHPILFDLTRGWWLFAEKHQ